MAFLLKHLKTVLRVQSITHFMYGLLNKFSICHPTTYTAEGKGILPILSRRGNISNFTEREIMG